MNEALIKRRLKRTIAFIASIFIIIIIITLTAGFYISQNVKEATHDEILTETKSYKNRISQQINRDYEILNTYASVVEHDQLYNSANFPSLLNEANKQNSFDTMAYFDKDYTGIIATLDQSVQTHVQLTSVSTDIQDVIQQTFTTQKQTSLFSKELNSVLYGTPVFDNQQVIGAFVAIESFDIFESILNEDTVFNGNGYIHLINQDGDFLIRSQRIVIPENISSIFENNHFEDSQANDFKQQMQSYKEVYDSFEFNNHSYQLLLEPLEMNHLYLFSINTVQDSNRFLYSIIKIIILVSISIFILVIIILVYFYKLMNKHNKELIHLAYHDHLTGAYNLTYFTKLANNEYQHDSMCSIVAINIHQFKFINELFGKEQGNKLLCHMGHVIEKNLKKDEFFCRSTADLFYIYLKESSQDIIKDRINHILKEIASFSQEEQSNYRLHFYCGVALSHQENEQFTIDELMTHVMFALATAKERHNHKIWFYNLELHKQEKINNYIESHMHQALKDHEFRLYLQPKIDLKTQQLASGEALVRWIKQDGTAIYPTQFIPLFEKNGFCTQLDMYMFEYVCKQIHEWIQQGIDPIPISINQSRLLFYEPHYIENIKNIMEKYNVPPQFITLEILEGLALNNVDELNEKIHQLQKIGVRISMDDFGSGYSSLNILGKLDINELKIDQAFLEEASHTNTNTKIIMESIIQISKRLSISTVVEGVETKEDHDFIQKLGCDYGQGYLYSKPIDIHEFNMKFMNTRSQK